MTIARSVEFHEAVVSSIKNAVIEELSTAMDKGFVLKEFIEIVSRLRDYVNIPMIQKTSIEDFWEGLRADRKEEFIGRLTYRFLVTLHHEYGHGVIGELASDYGNSLSNIFVLEGIDDVNKDRIKSANELVPLLKGNPWFLFLLISENQLGYFVNLLRELNNPHRPGKPE